MAELTVQTQLIARSLKDPAFRQAVLNDPRAVLAREYNVQVPDHIAVRVLEETPNSYSIVLPPQEEAVQELSDEELEAVAGGEKTFIIHFWTFICYTQEDV